MRDKTQQLRQRKKQPTKHPIIPIGALVLLLAMAAVVSVSLAKMRTVSEGTDKAQVAAFITEANGDGTEPTIDCSKPEQLSTTYTVTVTNHQDTKTAEVSLTYDVVMTLPDPLPDSLTVEMDQKKGVTSEDKKTITFEKAGTFTAGNSDREEHILTITADPNQVTEDYTLKEITIDVIAEQID